MHKHLYLIFCVLLSGCHHPQHKYGAIAPIGKVPQNHNTSFNNVKGEPGKMLPSQTVTAACNEYRGMMTAPMDPVAMKALKDKCNQ